MESDAVYENIGDNDLRVDQNPSGTRQLFQSSCDTKGGRRYWVITTVFLGILCLLLLVGIVIQYLMITTEREEQNLRIKNVESQNRLLKDRLANALNASRQGLIFMSPEALNWSDSRQYCRNHGADLIIINSEEKQRKVSSLIQETMWIGLTDMEKEGEMKWVNDSPLDQGFWAEYEPNNAGGIEDCVEIQYSMSSLKNWNDEPCSSERRGLCQK